MLFTTLLTGALFTTSTLAIYVDVTPKAHLQTRDAITPENLLACGPKNQPCKCPENSYYTHSTTYAYYPAQTRDVTAITGNFFDITWFGHFVNSTEGSPYVAGSKRAGYEVPPDGKDKLLTQEQLSNYTRSRDGGFFYSYNTINTPLRFNKTDGTIGAVAGSWEFIEVKEITPGFTSMIWDIHACLTDRWALGPFHESAMGNVTNILRKRRQLGRGQVTGPFTI